MHMRRWLSGSGGWLDVDVWLLGRCDGTLVLGSIKGGKVLVVRLMPFGAQLFVLVWLLPR